MTWMSFLLSSFLIFAATSVLVSDTAVSAEVAEIAASAPLTEDQIPVQAVTKKNQTAAASYPMQRAISVIGVMLVLILGCFVAVKRYAQKSNKKNTGMEIKFLTQHYLGPKKSLAVIRVAGESILIGMTEHNISHIKTLSLLDEDIPQDVAKDFDQELSKSVRLSAQKKAESPAENEDFSFSGIKDIVSSRLKNMRSLE
jgi:flagellar protein FliO/FliZ